jgi:hypothetical protein
MFKHLFKYGVENLLKNNTLNILDGETVIGLMNYCGVESNYISNSFSQIFKVLLQQCLENNILIGMLELQDQK